ncbi:hypothetical protein ACOKM5_34700 [Streptomyces sp. BH097]|uniref:hypothetical protein n=1 Tax=unclassified Streptomyces TaxID=2593676 RepID=UPI003BB5E77D
MSEKSTHGDIHTGDVSGTFIVGDNNRMTTTTHPAEQARPPQEQRNAAEDQAAAFAVQHGDMHVTYNAAAPEAEASEGGD